MLPRLIVIADGFTNPHIAAQAREAARAGAPWVMLRDRQATSVAFTDAATTLVADLAATNPPPLVSLTARLTVAHRLQTNLHLGKYDVSIEEGRRVLPSTAIIGYSAHAHPEVAAFSSAADYFFVSPIYPSSHRPDSAPLGLESLTRCARAAGDRPVFALGGVTPVRTPACLDAGAHGVAVISGVFSADDVAGAVRAYLDRLPGESSEAPSSRIH